MHFHLKKYIYQNHLIDHLTSHLYRYRHWNISLCRNHFFYLILIYQHIYRLYNFTVLIKGLVKIIKKRINQNRTYFIFAKFAFFSGKLINHQSKLPIIRFRCVYSHLSVSLNIKLKEVRPNGLKFCHFPFDIVINSSNFLPTE